MERWNQEYVPEDDEKRRREKYVHIPENIEITSKYMCIRKVISDKQIKTNAVHNILQQSWGRYAGVRVQEITEDVILFEFENEDDQKDAMDLCPWAIQDHCLSLKMEKRYENIQHTIQYDTVLGSDFGLKLDKFSAQNADKIGEYIGKVIEIDQIWGPQCLDRDYLRIKVEIEATKSLLAGFWYTGRNSEIGEA